MTLFSWLWILWVLAFGVIEAIALSKKERLDKPRTLTANIKWLITGAAPWHGYLRLLLAFFLGWLTQHFLGS